MSSTPNRTPERTLHWVHTCDRINRMSVELGFSSNYVKACKVLREYCIEQKELAEAEGYDDTAQYIQHVIDDLP